MIVHRPGRDTKLDSHHVDTLMRVILGLIMYGLWFHMPQDLNLSISHGAELSDSLAIGIGCLGGMADIFNLYQVFWERAKGR
jgi:hypothetical protein